MTTDPQRFRHRTPEVEAVQWTGSNTDQLATFCSPFDFQTIDPEDRVEDPDQTAAVRESKHGTWRGLAPGDWVVRLDGGFYEMSAADFAAQFEPAASAVASPPPATRADVLREAAQRLYTALFPAVYADMGQKAAEGVNRAVSELRRMAAEAQQQPAVGPGRIADEEQPAEKLIRDLIPDLFPIPARTADTTEMPGLLRRKLTEETAEALAADEEGLLEELADVLEVVHALAAVHGHSRACLEAVREAKAGLRGRFERRLVMQTRAADGEQPVPQRAYPDCERCGDTGLDPEQGNAGPCPDCQPTGGDGAPR